MRANNMQELENMMRKEMRKALSVIEKKALADMHEEAGDFYTGGEPKMYERTGALGDTPKTTEIKSNGNEMSFKAYLDTNYTYTTGVSPSMEAVLTLANKGSYPGLKPTVGKTGFWDRAEKKIKKDFNDVMKSFFK